MIHHIYHIGTHRLPDSERPRVRVINLLALIGLTLTCFYTLLYGLAFGSWLAAGVNVLFAVGYAAYFGLVSRGMLRGSKVWLVLVYVTQMAVFSLWVFSPQSGLHLFVVAGIPLTFVVFGHRDRHLRTAHVTALIAIFLLAELLDTPKLLGHLSPAFHRISYLTVVPLIGLLVAVVLQAFVHELHQRDAALQHLSVTDPLTNVANRRGLLARADSLHAQAMRHHLPLCVVMLDIDHFKAVNDLHGHATGDRLLTQVADMLRRTVRKEDAVGRVGGEEFAVVLANTPLTQGLAVAETLRQKVAEVQVHTDKGPHLGCTASLGITALTATDTDFSRAMARADKALYQAKAGGRNRVCSL